MNSPSFKVGDVLVHIHNTRCKILEISNGMYTLSGKNLTDRRVSLSFGYVETHYRKITKLELALK